MEELASALTCNLTNYKSKTGEILSIYVSSIDSIKVIINYFDKYPLLGDKLNDYNKWKLYMKWFYLNNIFLKMGD